MVEAGVGGHGARSRRGAGQTLALALLFLLYRFECGSAEWGANDSKQATRSQATRFHPGRILLMPLNEGRLAELGALHASGRARVTRAFPQQGNLQVVRLSGEDTVESAMRRYRASGLVRFVEPDYVVSASSVFPSDARFQDGTQWALNNYGQNGGLPDADIDGPEGWDVRLPGGQVVVAVIDTGIRHTHEDLAANLWQNPADGTPGFNAFTGGHDPWDDNGHGTHLAGIIGAATDNGRGIAGVSWVRGATNGSAGVRLMAGKFLDNSGNGNISEAIACIEFARTNGAQVINLSWGGPDYSEALSNALWFARADGIVVVAAAGNSARSIDQSPYYPAAMDLDNVVSVGASTRLDGLWLLSNYGAQAVDLFAPGYGIYSTAATGDAAYISRDGTSMASAFVSGACALVLAYESGLGPDALIRRLLAGVDPAPAFAGKCVTAGRLNIRKVLDRPTLALKSNSQPLQLLVTGIPNHWYTVEACENLTTWAPIRTNRANAQGAWSMVDEQSTNAPFRFYRAGPAP